MLLVIAGLATTSCKKNGDESENGSETDPKVDGLVFVENGINYIGNGDRNHYVQKGDFELDASKTYILRGWVYIQDGSTMTIPAGTIIKGQYNKTPELGGASLIIEPGAKIFARGTAEKPVVFTSQQAPGSRKPCDWGGVIILGKGRNNLSRQAIEGGPASAEGVTPQHGWHGGDDDNDNSGVFCYVRIEFAGYPFAENAEINGLTLGSVGKATELHHVQVSYAGDDSFEWFGGSVDCKYLVAYHGWDDDFDTDNGFSGTLQFLLGVRHPKIADQSTSNGFESDNNANGSTATPFTAARFSNVTLVGPIGQDVNFANNVDYINAGNLKPVDAVGVGRFQAGVQIRRNSCISLTNSVIIGYPVGLVVENDKGSQTQTFADGNTLISNVFFGGYSDNAADATVNNTAANPSTILGSDRNNTWQDTYSDDGTDWTAPGTKSFSHTYVLKSGLNNVITATIDELMLNNPRSTTDGSFTYYSSANYGPKSGSPLINAAFTVPSGFDAAGNGYAGAFKSDNDSDNWLRGWTNFDPQNTAY